MAAKKMITRRRWKKAILALLRSHGYSLLELVIVMAVFAILVTTAVSSYRNYVQRAHRAEAIRQMLGVAGCQEGIRADTGFYDTTRCMEKSGAPSHVLRIEPADDRTTMEYTIVAELKNGRDDACGSLGLDQAGTRSIGGAPEALAKCWSGR